MSTVHDGHRIRLKQRFLDNGLENFPEHVIIELLLFYGISRKNTNEIAHELINKFKSVSGVFDADINELMEIKGITEHTAILLKLIPQLLNVYVVEKQIDQKLNNVKSVCEYFKTCYVGVKLEQLKVCCLDDNLRVVDCLTVQEGNVNTVSVDVRKIIETIFKTNCSMVILSHNHPNGTAIPSNADIVTTQKIFDALKVVGISMLDHIIVAPDGVISMKDNGYFDIFD